MKTFISIRQILDDVLEHPLLKTLSFDRAVNYTVQFIRLLGMPNAFIEKTDLVEIKDYRGVLPCDVNNIIQVRLYDPSNKKHRIKRVFRYSSDNFHMSDTKPDSPELTYKVQNNIIFTSIQEGTIEIAYHALMVDDESYPMIPDSPEFVRALEMYIKKNYFTVLAEVGKMDYRLLPNIQQDYAWAVGQAQSSLIRPSVDEMQMITNSLNTLVVRASEHSTGFINNGTQEKIKRH